MRKGVVEAYAVVVAIALLMLLGLSLASSHKRIELKQLVKFVGPKRTIFCKKELASFKVMLSNPYSVALYAKLNMLSATNITSVSLLPGDLVIVPPQSSVKLNIVVNTTVPNGLYRFEYVAYLYKQSKDSLVLTGVKRIGGYIRVANCIYPSLEKSFEGQGR